MNDEGAYQRLRHVSDEDGGCIYCGTDLVDLQLGIKHMSREEQQAYLRCEARTNS